ncbi:MAG: heme exporter protein CcmD [Proteobacteria bacterium]|nr:heme exporter protein CcmD [Pseudomonadota bacterium]
MAAFLEMGGYAAYVWPAYALSAVLLVVLGAGSWRRLREAERELADLDDGRDTRP